MAPSVPPAAAAGYAVGAGILGLYSASQPASVPSGIDPYYDDPTPYNPSTFVGVPQTYRAVVGYDRTGYLGQSLEPNYRKPIYTQNDLANAAQLPQDQMLALQMRLVNMGALTQPDYPGFFDSATHDALEQVMGIANTRGWSMDQMEKYLDDNHKAFKDMGWTSSYGSTGSGGADYGPTTVTSDSTSISTQENISLTGRGGARAVLVQAMANEMGREPTKKEVDRFLRSLNKAERNNPATTKSTTTTHQSTTTDPSKSGDTSVSSTSTSDTKNVSRASDVDPSQRAEHFAEKTGGKEAQAFQAGRFMDVLSSLIGL
jgi:hypothetical protein